MMIDFIRRHTAVALAIVAVVALTATPVFAQLTNDASTYAPSIARNADKVDGKHAVGASASKAKRAGKLVATNKNGRLPNDIIKVNWSQLKGVPADIKDGDDVGYFSGIAFTSVTPLGTDDNVWLVSSDWPTGMHVEWSAIPTNTSAGTEFLSTFVEIERQTDGKLEYWINVNQGSGDNTTHYKLRYVAFDMGVAPASGVKKSIRSDIRTDTKAVKSRRSVR